MKVVNAQIMRAMDEKAINDYGIHSIVLMEHAANALFSEMIKIIDKDQKIYIVCGQGNNGGDGFALARMLFNHDYQVRVYCKDVHHLSKDANYEFECLKHTDVCISNEFELKDDDVIVDALFGTGLTRNIEGIYEQIIQKINESHCKVISIDIASGLDATTGEIKNIAVKADLTFSFVAYKLGNVINEGKQYSGEVKILDIHMPKAIVDDSEGYILVDYEIAKKAFPKRIMNSHKGTYGKVLIVGGSSDMHGALYLCANACLQSGVGLCTLFIPNVLYEIVASDLKECMCIKANSKNGYFDEEAYQQLKAIVNDYEIIVVGNGMGRNEVTKQMIACILESKAKVIIDGDGIYELSKQVSLLNRQEEVIITPHMKEMSYLTQYPLKDILNNREVIGNDFVKTYPNVTLVLKDQITTIHQNKQQYLFQDGHHALAKGGSGDVLCGMIAGLYAQSKNSLNACIAAVYVHGLIAKKLAQQYSAYSILGRDLISQLKTMYKEMED